MFSIGYTLGNDVGNGYARERHNPLFLHCNSRSRYMGFPREYGNRNGNGNRLLLGRHQVGVMVLPEKAFFNQVTAEAFQLLP